MVARKFIPFCSQDLIWKREQTFVFAIVIYCYFHFVIHLKRVFIIIAALLFSAGDIVNWFSMALTLGGKTRGRGDIMGAVLPCGGRKRAFEGWARVRRERLISYQRAVWLWCYFNGLNFNYIWARHWRLNRGLGLVRANSLQHSSCYCSCVCGATKLSWKVFKKWLDIPWRWLNAWLFFVISPLRSPSSPSTDTAGSSELNLAKLWTMRPRQRILWQ